MSPVGAAAVAVLGLLLGCWLVAGAADRAPDGNDLPGGSVPAGWVLLVLSVLLLVLATPTAPGNAPAQWHPASNSAR